MAPYFRYRRKIGPCRPPMRPLGSCGGKTHRCWGHLPICSNPYAKPPEGAFREEAVACPSESHFPWEATTRIVFFPKRIPMGRGMTDH